MAAQSRPVVAGVVTALVGWTSSFAVVLAGLRAVGASPAQGASGLMALSLAMGVCTVIISRRTRLPVTFAWSTPGAALLVSTGAVAGGWPAAVGAFLITGVLILLTAIWPGLSTLIGKIPTPVAQAMLAGVLLTICLQPVRAVVATPVVIIPVIVVWLIMMRFAARWAVPAAFVAVLVITVITATTHTGPSPAGAGPWPQALWPSPIWTTPEFGLSAVIGIAVPLYVVTMAAQNVPGVAVLASYGYRAPWRPAMAFTGAGTVLGAPFGGSAINLAAITAALSASPEADPDPKRRWVAAQTAGWCYLVFGLAATALVGVFAAAPPGLVEAAAGLALLPTLGSALSASVGEPTLRIPAVVTFLVAAGGVSVFGIGPAFWALAAGLVCTAVLRLRTQRADPEPTSSARAA